VGRYPEDKYDPTDNSGKGNPWFICTAAIGELYYQAANSLDAKGSLVVSEANKGLLSSLDSTKFSSLQLGQTLSRNDSQFADVLATLRTAGDAQLRRIKYHADADRALSEQYDRNDGHEKSFRDLTWSYVSLLTAVDKRRTDTALHSSQPRPILDFKPNPSAPISGSRERPFVDPARAPDRNGSRSSTFPSARPSESQQSTTLLHDRLRISPAPLYAQPLNRVGIPIVRRRTESTTTSQKLDVGNERAAKTLEEFSRRLSELERAVERLSKQQRADRPEKQK